MTSATILVVDDNAAVRSLLRFILEGEGYGVLEAASSEDALQISQAGNGEFDLLLTDVRMPGMDGIELAGKVATMRPSLRVLYISGHCDLEDPPNRLLGAEFLAKPFSPVALLRGVRRALGTGPQVLTNPG